MQGLSAKSLKKHPALIPLYVAVGIGFIGAVSYTLRLATRNPDVTWNRSANPEPWQEYANKQYKFVTTRTDMTSKAPKFE